MIKLKKCGAGCNCKSPTPLKIQKDQDGNSISNFGISKPKYLDTPSLNFGITTPLPGIDQRLSWDSYSRKPFKVGLSETDSNPILNTMSKTVNENTQKTLNPTEPKGEKPKRDLGATLGILSGVVGALQKGTERIFDRAATLQQQNIDKQQVRNIPKPKQNPYYYKDGNKVRKNARVLGDKEYPFGIVEEFIVEPNKTQRVQYGPTIDPNNADSVYTHQLSLLPDSAIVLQRNFDNTALERDTFPKDVKDWGAYLEFFNEAKKHPTYTVRDGKVPLTKESWRRWLENLNLFPKNINIE